jgi:hypothetical protein
VNFRPTAIRVTWTARALHAEQQAAAGFLVADDPVPEAAAFGLTDGVAAVLLDEGGPDFVGTPASSRSG